MTIHDLIKVAKKKLTGSTPARHASQSNSNTLAGVAGRSPELDGEVLLSFVLKKPKEFLLAHPHKQIDPKIEKVYFRLINKRLLGWPVAYLVKHKEFYNLDFYVDKNVLIPRPETEGLVELVIDQISAKGGSASGGKKPLSILDVGTGSGNIIISLVNNLEKRSHSIYRGNKAPMNRRATQYKFFASDISPQAIKVAKKNAKQHKVKVTFGDGNLLEPWGDQKFDILVANLPYLSRETDPSTKFEPKGALIAAKKGIKLYEELFKQIAKKITPPSPSYFKRGKLLSNASKRKAAVTPPLKIRGGWEGLFPKLIAIEIGRDQRHIIKKLAKKYLPAKPSGGPAYVTKTYKDLFGRTRYTTLAKLS